MGEEWRRVPFALTYEASDLGQIRSWRECRGRPTPHLMKGCFDEDGYVILSIVPNNGKRRQWRLHQLVAAAFLGEKPAGYETRHLDGNKLNNRITNLAYGTASENGLDRVRHGTHHKARVTECIQGHEYTEENTYRAKNGTRKCRECHRTRWRKAS